MSYYNLGYIYRKQGNFVKVVEYLSRCVELEKFVQNPDLKKAFGELEMLKELLDESE